MNSCRRNQICFFTPGGCINVQCCSRRCDGWNSVGSRLPLQNFQLHAEGHHLCAESGMCTEMRPGLRTQALRHELRLRPQELLERQDPLVVLEVPPQEVL